ncbi:MAG: hypothetical protein AAFX44_16145 [Pseudomonadota bacterium]
MGAKAWALFYSNGDVAADLRANPAVDQARSSEIATALFPKAKLTADGATDFYDLDPRGKAVHVGCFGATTVVCAEDVGIDYPSKLDPRFIDAPYGDTLYLLATHSVVDWFAFGIWHGGKLIRSFSAMPDTGIVEDIGEPLKSEQPFRAGKRPAVEPGDEYPLDFHPLDLCEAVFDELCGFVLEGQIKPEHIEPEDYVLLRFKRKRRWWPF